MGGPNDLARRAERRAMIGSFADREFDALQLREFLELLAPFDGEDAGGTLPAWVRRRLHLVLTPSASMDALLGRETGLGVTLHELIDIYLQAFNVDVVYFFNSQRLSRLGILEGRTRAELRAEALRVVAEAGAPALPRGGGRVHAALSGGITGSASSPSSTTRVATQSSSL